MKILSESPTLGPIRLMHCQCSVWPIVTAWLALTGLGECGDCGVRPRLIPEWRDDG